MLNLQGPRFGSFLLIFAKSIYSISYSSESAACAAASLAIGTRYGEQDT